MVKLARVVTVVYAAVVGVAMYLLDPVQVAAAAGSVTAIASLLANALPDGTWYDAICNGLAINVVPGKTAGK